MTKSHNLFKPLVIAFFFVIILCVIGFLVIDRISSSTEIRTLTSFARDLDYTSNAKLAEYEKCWDIFQSNCGRILYYTTSLPVEEFHTKVNNVTSTKELPGNSSVLTLFDINYVTNHKLTVEEETGSGSSGKEPLAYKWILEERGEEWVITFYDIANDNYIYKMDGQRIVGNIVTILMMTK